MRIKLYCDGANLEDIRRLSSDEKIQGFTTNPTLMKKAGIKDYYDFAREAVSIVNPKPISLEVFSDDLDEMYIQAKKLSELGNNVYVKIPVTNTDGEFTGRILKKLSSEGVKLNVTAIFTLAQVKNVCTSLTVGIPAVISVFAGRVADTGADPIPHMMNCKRIIAAFDGFELLWASPREVLNVYQADNCGCEIITATPGILSKLALQGKSLDEFSLETVKMFYNDAASAGYTL
jgi:transaldolase